jgi:hypothetical protein
MKKLTLILLLLSVSLSFYGHKELSGLWMGSLSNDSNTVRKDQNIEFLLAEYKGKVTGYTRTTFMVDDNLYYIVKRVKGEIKGDICEVEDDDVITHNFPKRPEKKVSVVSTFYRNKADSNWYLSGDWKTNQTRKYYTISGKMDLMEEKDLAKSKLFPHLQELGLEKNLPYYQEAERSNAPILAKTHIRPQQQRAIDNPDSDVALNTRNVKTNTTKVDPVINLEQKNETGINPEAQQAVARNTGKPNANSVKTNTTKIDPIINLEQKNETGINPEAQQAVARNTGKPNANSVKTNTTKVDPVINLEQKNETGINPETQQAVARNTGKPNANSVKSNTTTVAPVINLEQKTETGINPEKQQGVAKQDSKTGTPTVKTNTFAVAPVTATVSAPEVINEKPFDPAAPAAFASQRKTEATQFINFTTDSLVFALYDNGEVDGDTVSVLVDGEVFMAKQGLKTSALRKTYYLPAGTDELTLILYAENLGKYPPNTGLLIVYDGEERHQVRFSADLNKNAGVVFRRKK